MIGDGATDEKDLDLDNSKVQFIKANGDTEAHIDMGESDSGSFCGLTKEELMKYADDPYWVRVRRILLALFWLVWLGMLAAAIIIIVLAPKCPPRPDLEWWQKCSVQEVYPRSFKDSDGDGVGDIKGIEDKLNYIKDNQADAVLLSSVYKSPNTDFGYDVVDHKEIQKEYGTMEDFDSLKSAIHRNGLKLILDFIPNHSSKDHMWFQESSKGADNEYSDFYMWANGKGGSTTEPPNKWVSAYGGSAWTYSASRGQWYLHHFSENQPELNLRNPKVMQELDDILTFWLDHGADGFRVDSAAYLFEDSTLKDEPSADKKKYTMFQNETYEAIAHWREIIDNRTSATNEGKYLMVEASGGDVAQVMRFYEYGANAPLNGQLLKLGPECGSSCAAEQVAGWIDVMNSEKYTANWQLGNHDTSRVASRLPATVSVKAANLLLLTLPGTAITYYGDEIGMTDNMAITETRDTLMVPSRDPERTPMQWNDGIAAGFSNTTNTWLPVNENYHTTNVKTELAQGRPASVLKLYREIVALRDEPSMQWGKYQHTDKVSSKIYGYVRQAQGFDGYLVAVNLDATGSTANFHEQHPDIVPAKGKVVAHTGAAGLEKGRSLSMDKLYLPAGEGFVFKWTWEDSPTNE